jgi:hypothetical protein
MKEKASEGTKKGRRNFKDGVVNSVKNGRV